MAGAAHEIRRDVRLTRVLPFAQLIPNKLCDAQSLRRREVKTFQFFDPNSGVAKFKSAEGLRSYFPAYFKLKLSILPRFAYIDKYVG